MSTKKEIKDITQEEIATEEVKEIAQEVKDVTLEEPVLRAPLVPSSPNHMIQKHVDNFLAKIAGETPVDDNPRNSTEYWLNKIADAGGGGEKLYTHNIIIKPNSESTIILFACSITLKDNTPFTMGSFIQYMIDHFNTRDKMISGTGAYYYGSPAIGISIIGAYSDATVPSMYTLIGLRLDDFSYTTVSGANSQYLTDNIIDL